MGLFSRLFGGPSQDDRSYVRMWAEKRRRELSYSNDLSRENLFAVMMYCLSCFGEKDTAEIVPSEMKELGFDTSDHYSGDASLFELGCYMYVRLDLWLYKHKPDHREAVSTTFVKEFIKLFSQALNSRDILSLFDQRVTQYGKLARTGADLEEYHRHLSQLILRTRDNQLPQSYDFENIKEPLMLGIIDEFGVKTALIAWEEYMLPASLRNIEKYCDLTE